MSKRTFVVREVPGASKTSSRNLTHAVIGEMDWDRKVNMADRDRDVDKVNWQYYRKHRDFRIGSEIEDSEIVVTAESKKEAREKIGQRSLSQYLKYMREQRIQKVLEEREKSKRYEVLDWFWSFHLAVKAFITKFRPVYKNLKIVETKRI